METLEKTLTTLKPMIMNATENEADNAISTIMESSTAEVKLQAAASLLKHKERLKAEILLEASRLNESVHGNVIEFYAISYIADKCINDCSYCGHNRTLDQARSMLDEEGLKTDLRAALEYGASDLCILAGEHPDVTPEYLALAANIAIQEDILRSQENARTLDRVTFNVAPMTTEQFKKLRESIETQGTKLQYRIFQESYDRSTYARVHQHGPKKNFDFRLAAQQRALDAGFEHVGIGALFGINMDDYPYKSFGNDFEILALIAHAYALKEPDKQGIEHEKQGTFPYSLSIPRLQMVDGTHLTQHSDIDDETYLLYHAILKLAVPQTKLIITSRETPEMKDLLRPFINIEDLAPRPGVGGNYRQTHFQNMLGDARDAESVIKDIREKGYGVKIRATK